jgi:hypothetical protein
MNEAILFGLGAVIGWYARKAYLTPWRYRLGGCRCALCEPRIMALLLLLLIPADVDAGPKRSTAARRQFLQQTGYPKGRPGYVVDHIVPLACGGLDQPANMQWQTREEAKAKDKWERRDCQPVKVKKL